MNAALIIIAFAGTGERGYTGDGGPAAKAKLDNPFAVVVAKNGDVYFSDTNNHVVRRVEKGTGTISTVAGTGKKGYSGDKGPASKATLNEPYGIAFDVENNLYIVDRLNFCIRMVTAKTGLISTVVGTGQSGLSPDGVSAANASLLEPNGICVAGNMLYIADVKAHRVRSVDLIKGTLGTLVGDGEKKSGDSNLTKGKGSTHGPRAVCTGPDDCIYLVEREGNCVRKIDVNGQQITRVAGTGKKGYTGDGGKALDCTFDGPKEIAVDKDGNIFVCDTENEAIRRIDAKTTIVTTVAGKGKTKTPGTGDGGDPLKATLGRPHGVAVGSDGALYIGDTLSHRIRVVK